MKTLACWSGSVSTPRGRARFDEGVRSSSSHDHFIHSGELERVYRSSGIAGVMNLVGFGKSQAYALVARAGINRVVAKEVLEKRTALKKVSSEAKNLAHCAGVYGWMPGQESCRIKARRWQYGGVVQFGGRVIPANTPFLMGSLPGREVIEFMRERGLKNFLVGEKIIPCGDLLGCKHAILYL
ncbi:MAG: hypothetical protein AAB391_02840 [Patescibacteria group bacterium]